MASVSSNESSRVPHGGGIGRPAASRLPQDESAALPEPAKGGTIATWFLLFYIWLDLIRPSFVWHFPKFLSTALFVTWLLQPDKRLPRQNLLMLLFLGVMIIDLPIAENSYAAVWATIGIAVLFLGLCLPFAQFINSIARFQVVMQSLMGIYVVIGAWASFHQGYGPAGTGGGQDENYVTACMVMGLPLLLYSSLSAGTKFKKIIYLAPIPILLLAVVVAENPSRGGFIGFVCTIIYMLYHSKKRVMALIAVGVLAACIGLVASDRFVDEIATTADTDVGTADHRKDLWRIATYMFMSYPLTGIGPMNYRWRIQDFETNDIIEKYGHSLGATAYTHSLYFELLAELGSAGVILFALIVVRNFRDLAEIKRRVRQIMDRKPSGVSIGEPIAPHLPSAGMLKLLECYAQGLTASLIGFLVCSAFISTLYYSYFWFYSVLIASFKVIADRVLPQPAGGPDRPMR
jgi:O-antigen ligase